MNPLASRVRRERRFRWVAEAMESGGLWVFVSAHWTAWGARWALRSFMRAVDRWSL